MLAVGAALHAFVLLAMSGAPALAQGTYSPVIITPPIVDTIDDNHVSLFSGKPQFTIPAVKLGEVSFTPFSFNGNHFQYGGLIDHNYGHIAPCDAPNSPGIEGRFECAVGTGKVALQVIYGEERVTFDFKEGQYVPESADGSRFADAGATCIWTKHDGTQIVFVAYHDAGNPLCFSNNIASITYPDGRIATYYYYGSFSTTEQSPILSISTSTGYMLKYIYSGTPSFGAETSVVAFNRAFQACDPAAVSCTLSPGWPAATLTWQDFTSTPCDGFPPVPGDPPCQHHIFTIQDAAQKKHVFELDSYYRVISYQPPDATAPAYIYKLCSLLIGNDLRNCFGYTTWPPYTGVFQPQPLLLDLVQTVTRNGQDWAYYANFNPAVTPPAFSLWGHVVTNPFGLRMGAQGNASPGMESFYGPIDVVGLYDNTSYQYERSVRNVLYSKNLPSGLQDIYSIDYRGNLDQLQQNAVPGSGLAPIIQSVSYPATCSSIYSCNKPLSVTDANGNQTDFTYDPAHGGMLTETDPAVNGIRPQTRRTYIQRHAWYLDAAGTMIRDANPVWLLATESYCRTSAASGSGCAAPNDETVTAYDYGPDSGPSNLLLRGKTVTADGQTHRTCTAHDQQGNKIWETSPNANPASCPDY